MGRGRTGRLGSPCDPHHISIVVEGPRVGQVWEWISRPVASVHPDPQMDASNPRYLKLVAIHDDGNVELEPLDPKPPGMAPAVVSPDVLYAEYRLIGGGGD